MATLTDTHAAITTSLRRNLVILLVFSLAAAVLVMVLPPLQGKRLTEINNDMVPLQIGSWVGQNYDMGAKVFEALKPDAIISRQYINAKGQQVDFVLLAGTHAETFHNPHSCFPGQGWRIMNNRKIDFAVPSVAKPFHARYFQIGNEAGYRATVIYWYRTPFGTTGSMGVARVSTYSARLIGMQRQQTFFYRFILPSSGNTEQDIEVIRQFANELFAVLKETLPEVI